MVEILLSVKPRGRTRLHLSTGSRGFHFLHPTYGHSRGLEPILTGCTSGWGLGPTGLVEGHGVLRDPRTYPDPPSRHSEVELDSLEFQSDRLDCVS